jgi:hypothetical protein
MGFTSYQHEADRDLIEALARGDWQKSLLAGVEAWDGSTIRDIDWLKEKIAQVGEGSDKVAWHIENRLKWTDHLAARIRESGFVLRIDGPSARIDRTDATVDDPGVKEAAAAAGIGDIPIQYHRVVLVGVNEGIAVYQCTASAVYPYGPFARAERFVLGGFSPEDLGQVSRIDRVHTTLRRALNRTRKIRKSIDDWTAYLMRVEADRKARDEARAEAERAADQARWLEAEGDIIADAFSEAA